MEFKKIDPSIKAREKEFFIGFFGIVKGLGGWGKSANEIDEVRPKCEALQDALINRPWNEFKWDAALVDLKKYANMPASDILEIICNFCAEHEIYWNTAIHTKQELDWFVSESVFGKTLLDYGCFSHQRAGNASATQASQPASTSGTASNGGGAARSTGGKANVINNKLFRHNCPAISDYTKKYPNSVVFWIKGDWVDTTKKTNVKISVSPKDADSLNVKYTSGNGAEDCILYFDNEQYANEFLDKCLIARPQTGTKAVANLYLRRAHAESNGYFEIDTNQGKALILASMLHEELEESEYKFDREPEDFESYNKYLEAVCEELNDFIN